MNHIERLIAYAAAVRSARQAVVGGRVDGPQLELALAPRFHAFLEACLPPEAPTLLAEYRRPGIGRPDLAFARAGQPARAFIELKVPTTSLNPRDLRGHDKAQFERFGQLPLWAHCNFHTIRLYRRAELIESAVILPAAALEPDTRDAMAERLIRQHDGAPFLAILDQLVLATPPQIKDARDIAHALAHAARLASIVIRDSDHRDKLVALRQVRQEFDQTLFQRAEAGGHEITARDAASRKRESDALFAAAFAQTLAFGMLLARDVELRLAAQEQRSPRDLGIDAYRLLPEGSLLRGTLRALTQDEIVDLLGVSFDVLRDTVNVISAEALQPRRGHDPILYFYEEFLSVFDPKARQKYGVFYTPVELVDFIIARTDAALRGPMGREGLRDNTVLLLDPACGTGTFSVAALRRVANEVLAEGHEGLVASTVSSLARRLNALELLVGPYTVAHWRIGREVAAHGGQMPERLPVWLSDTLARPDGTPQAAAVLGFMADALLDERKGGDKVKAQESILAILGNPPYRRLKSGEAAGMIGGWMNEMWEDLKAPVKRAGAGLSLNAFPDLYIAFWRWAVWRLFEAPGATGKGVVSFVTNRGFLAGRAFGGLRLLLRERFDEIEIVDLRGDSRGALPAGQAADQNIFDIKTGVAVLTAWANGSRPAGAEARVRYADIWDVGGHRRADKLRLLSDAAQGKRELRWCDLPQGGMTDLKPLGFATQDWPSVDQCFTFRSNGVVTYRDSFAYATRKDVLEHRIQEFLTLGTAEAAQSFGNSALNDAAAAQLVPFDPQRLRRASYRPLDRRWLYAHGHYVDRMRDELQAAWGDDNVALFALENGTGAGPSAWCHGQLPDQHAFRGSYGGWVFPLHDRTGGTEGHRLSPALMAGLAIAYGAMPTAQAVFDAMLALLSAPGYSLRFARDLEDALPHVPFPTDASLFNEASALGAEIRALQSFACAPAPAFRTARLLGKGSGVTLWVAERARFFLEDGAGGGFIPLLEDQSLRLAGVPAEVAGFAVSGYPVLLRWLEARRGDALDEAFHRELLDLVGRLAELSHLFAEADTLLERALVNTLSRGELGMPQPVPFGQGVVFKVPDVARDSPRRPVRPRPRSRTR